MSTQLSRSEWIGYGLYGWMLAAHLVVYVVWNIRRWRSEEPLTVTGNDVFFTFERFLLELTHFLVLSLVAYYRRTRTRTPHRLIAVAGDDNDDDDGESGIQLT